MHPDLLSLDPDPLSLDLDLQKVVQLCDLKKVNRELWIPSFQRKDFAAAVIRHWFLSEENKPIPPTLAQKTTFKEIKSLKMNQLGDNFLLVNTDSLNGTFE